MTAVSKRTGFLVSVTLALLVLVAPATVHATCGRRLRQYEFDPSDPDLATRVETAVLRLSGVGGSLSGLQSDVTSIKTKPDNTSRAAPSMPTSGPIGRDSADVWLLAAGADVADAGLQRRGGHDDRIRRQ